jgi:hypothetical protein
MLLELPRIGERSRDRTQGVHYRTRLIGCILIHYFDPSRE